MNDLLNALARTTDTFFNKVDQVNKQAADAKLRKMEVDLWQWQKDEMQKFENRSDIDNFQEEYKNDFNELEESYNTGDNKYENPYSSKIGNEMLYKLRAEGEVALSNVINDQQKRLANIYDNDTLNVLSNREQTQDVVDKQAAIINIGRTEGRKTPEQTHQELINVKTNAALKNTQQEVDTWIANNPNATQKDYNDFISNLSVKQTSVTFDGMEIPIDNAAIKSTITTYANNRIHEAQENTNNMIFGSNTEIMNHIIMRDLSDEDLIASINAQLAIIDRTPDLMLTEQDRRTRRHEIMRLLDVFKEEPSEERTEKATKTAYKEMIEVDPNIYINAAIAGSKGSGRLKGYKNAYLAKTAYLEEGFRIANEYAEGKLNRNEYELEFTQPFFEKLKSKYKADPNVNGVIKNVENLVKDYAAKSKDENYEVLLGELLDYTWDLIFDTDMSQFKPQDIINSVQNKLNIVVAKELSLKKIGNTGIFGSGGYNLGKALTNLSENDYAYTDQYGRQKVDEKAVDTVEEKVIPEMARALFALGIENATVDPIRQSESSMFDIDLYPEFSDNKGNKYTFIPNEKGYEVLMNGKVIGDNDKVREEWKKIDKTRRNELEEKIETMKGKRKELREKEKGSKEKIANINMTLANQKDVPITGWETMNQRERIDALYTLKMQDKDKYNEILKKYNLGE